MPAYVSDLVRDSRIKTTAVGSVTQHVFYEVGTSAQERRRELLEHWQRKDKILGEGSYGTVFLEKSLGAGPSKVRAVKMISKKKEAGESLNHYNEIEAIMKFSNPKYAHCFVQSQGWYESNTHVFITMEFLPLGDLAGHISKPLPEPEAQQIISQILEGLCYMHGNNFIHRDLKPSNILVVSAAPAWFVKISDFGISKRRQPNVATTFTLGRGTLGFVAPEAVGFSNTSYGPPADMWSLGAVAFRILAGRMALPNLSEMLHYIMTGVPYPTAALTSLSVSVSGQNFITQLTKREPDERPSAVGAAFHPWILEALAAEHPDVGRGVGPDVVGKGESVSGMQYPRQRPVQQQPTAVADPGPVAMPSAYYESYPMQASRLDVNVARPMAAKLPRAPPPTKRELKKMGAYKTDKWQTKLSNFIGMFKKPSISAPFGDVYHHTHVSYDYAANRYLGLPPQWQVLVNTSPSYFEPERNAA